jgi:hypothetical protein
VSTHNLDTKGQFDLTSPTSVKLSSTSTDKPILSTALQNRVDRAEIMNEAAIKGASNGQAESKFRDYQNYDPAKEK